MPWTTQEIQQFYDSYSKSYDAETSADTYPSPHILSCWLLQQLNSRKTQDSLSQRNILDIGCGTGQSSSIFFAQSLAEDRVNRLEFSVTGVDASPKVNPNTKQRRKEQW
jgi:2-polyprenyl-3-methyl-5-hydroxy-6-metoxy-1,4-benzoquinol methylase